MKLLIPSAKQMAVTRQGQPVDLAPSAQVISQVLAQATPDALAHLYKISTAQAELEYQRWQAIAGHTALSYPALALFDGLMYRQIDRTDAALWAYYQRHVLITTALYGVITPDTLIAPHRLDFMQRVAIEGQSLKQYWQTAYCQAVAKEAELVSLLSAEFEQVFDKATRERMIKIILMEQRHGQLKTHSTISKKGRGQLVLAAAQAGITEAAALKELSFAGYSYQAALSSAQEWVFVKVV